MIIKTVGNFNSCGFGYGVVADGEFKKVKNNKPNFFVNLEGQVVFFNKVKPEDFED